VLIAATVHSVQMAKPADVASLPAETRALWEKSGQTYLDWRKDELFFKRLVKMNRN
jgi:hypothetical protein